MGEGLCSVIPFAVATVAEKLHIICLRQVSSNRSLQKARIVTQRVPFGELKSVSELALPVQLTENVVSVPPGVFLFSPVFRAVCGTRPRLSDVSVSRRSLSGSGRYASSARDFG